MHGLMPRTMMPRLSLAMFWLAVGGVGCVPQYRPPTLSEPHAVVKVRVAYHSWPGPQVDQVTLVDGHAVQDLPAPLCETGMRQSTREGGTHILQYDFLSQTPYFHTALSGCASSPTCPATSPRRSVR